MTLDDALTDPAPDASRPDPPLAEPAAPAPVPSGEQAHGVPGDAESLTGRVHRLDPAFVTASRLVSLVSTGMLVLTATFGVLIFWIAADEKPVAAKIAIAGAAYLFVALIGVLGFLWPPLEFRRTTWRVGPDGFEIKRGVVFRHVVTVPRNRIQHTDVAQGPIQRRFGLATLSVHTAGTQEYEVQLSGIDRELALLVRDTLLEGHEGREGDGA